MKFNDKFIRAFNSTYARACFHKKKKIRKKNYARARRMLEVPMPYPIDFTFNNPGFRKKYKAMREK